METSCIVSACKVGDYIPFLSIVPNTITLIAKAALSVLAKCYASSYAKIKNYPFVEYVNQKSVLKCILLCIPGVNVLVALITRNQPQPTSSGSSLPIPVDSSRPSLPAPPPRSEIVTDAPEKRVVPIPLGTGPSLAAGSPGSQVVTGAPEKRVVPIPLGTGPSVASGSRGSEIVPATPGKKVAVRHVQRVAYSPAPSTLKCPSTLSNAQKEKAKKIIKDCEEKKTRAEKQIDIRLVLLYKTTEAIIKLKETTEPVQEAFITNYEKLAQKMVKQLESLVKKIEKDGNSAITNLTKNSNKQICFDYTEREEAIEKTYKESVEELRGIGKITEADEAALKAYVMSIPEEGEALGMEPIEEQQAK